MIYIAAPLFSDMEKDYIENLVFDICRELKLNINLDFYIPHRDNNNEDFEDKKYKTNIQNLNECDIMIAILDGKDVDSGTAFEIGYFDAQDKIVLGLLTDKRSYNEDHELNEKLNTMIYGSCIYGNNVFDNIDCLIDELYDILKENYGIDG